MLHHLTVILRVAALCVLLTPPSAEAEFRAGSYAIRITPQRLPAIMNGGFLEKLSDQIDDDLHARCLVLDDGNTTIGLAIVDSCMIPTDLCDAVKQRVQRRTGIATDRLVIAATHTHSAPSVMDYCLGSRRDERYADLLVERVADGLAEAHARLQPAAAGWTVVQAPHHTHCRRWLLRPGSYELDPFGERTVRAMMHPGYQNPAYSEPAGPVDSALTLLAVHTRTGRPLCVLANYSMHYFGGSVGFSADYFGDFCRYVEQKLGPADAERSPMTAMSQGTSGDLHWMDYSRPQRTGYSRGQYARELGDLALQALSEINYRSEITLAMAETRLRLRRRLPTPDRTAWAKDVNALRGSRQPQDRPEVYAQQAEWLAGHAEAEVVLQALRIGELGFATIPNEVFGITGLKLKAQSPLQPLMNMELANGAEGYIPPPEQHFLGGYTTWPARTAGLEVGAEPKIVDSLLALLEQIAPDQQRRPLDHDLYSEVQRRAIQAALDDNNNRENRGE